MRLQRSCFCVRVSCVDCVYRALIAGRVLQLYCGSGPGRLVCFKYEDFTQTFQFWGLNADLRLVPKSEAEHTTFI